MQESGEMYLESILLVGQKRGKVRSVDVADEMHFSKPSVSRAISKLKADECIVIDSGGCITLTERGRAVAEKIYERHQILSKILISLGVDETVALEDACRIEHVISDASFAAIKAHVSTRE